MRDISFHSHFSSFFIGDFINAFESSSFLFLLDFVNAKNQMEGKMKQTHEMMSTTNEIEPPKLLPPNSIVACVCLRTGVRMFAYACERNDVNFR